MNNWESDYDFKKRRKDERCEIPENPPQPDFNEPCPDIKTTGRRKEILYVSGNGGDENGEAEIMIVSPALLAEDSIEFIQTKSLFDKLLKEEPRAFKGPAGSILRDIIASCGIPDKDCYFTNVCKWLLPKANRLKPKPADIKWALASFDKEIKRVKPKIVICTSKLVFDIFYTGVKLKADDVLGALFYDKIRKVHFVLVDNVYLLASRPEYVEKYRNNLLEIKKLLDKIRGIEIPDVELNYRILTNKAQLVEWVEFIKKENILTFANDCEWSGNNFIDGKLRLAQFCWAPGQVVCIRFMNSKKEYVFDIPYKEVGEILGEHLNKPEVKYIGHSMASDFCWLKHWLNLDIYKKCFMDTMFARQCVDEHSDLGLERLALEYTSLNRYDIELLLWRKANPTSHDDGFGSIPEDIIEPYACLRKGSLVQLEDDSWKCIDVLVDEKYTGKVKSLVDGEVKCCNVTNWHKNDVNQQDWFQIITPSTEKGKHGFLGPVLTPDHKVLTNRGNLRVDSLIPGDSKIITEEKKLSKDQICIILGSLLGDGSLRNRNNCKTYLYFSQSERRSSYADWKADSLSNVLKFSRIVRPAVGNKTSCTNYRSFCSKQLIEVLKLFSRTSSNVFKLFITENLLDALGPLGLAVWYQDDGVFAQGKHCRIICTKLTEEEICTSTAWFTSNFGEVKYDKKQGCLRFSLEASIAFLKHISPYINPSVSYKSNIPCSESLRCLDLDSGLMYQEPILQILRVFNKKVWGRGIRYCISVPEAGNFLTKAGFVSNCADADVTFRSYPFILEELVKQNLWDYYKNILNPFVTDVFPNFTMEGLPIDVPRVDELRDLLFFAKEEMLKVLRVKMVQEAICIFSNEFFKYSSDALAYQDCMDAYLNPETRNRNVFNLALKDATGTNFTKFESIVDHLFISSVFNPGAGPMMRKWLFDVKGFIPIKSTNQKNKGLPSQAWEKVLELPPARRNLYSPSADKQSVKILAATHNDATLAYLMKYSNTYSLSKSFLNQPDVDENGDVVKENGIHYYITSKNTIASNWSLTETGRPRSWKPNVLNYPSYSNAYVTEGIKELFNMLNDKGELPERYKKYLILELPSVRSIVQAPPNMTLVSSDYQTAEVRALAYISGDKNLMYLINSNDPQFGFLASNPKVTVRTSFDEVISGLTNDNCNTDYLYALWEKGKIVGHVTEEDLLRDVKGEIVRPKIDLHWSIVEMANTKPREDLDKKKDRDGMGKPTRFSTAYGSSDTTLERLIEVGTGIKPEPGTGKKLLATLRAQQPDAQDHLEELGEMPKHKDFIVAASGRKRRFHGRDLKKYDYRQYNSLMSSQGRESRNYFCQELIGATSAIACQNLLDFCIKNNLRSRPIMCLYDSIVSLCPLEERAIIAKAHQRFMCDKVTWNYDGQILNFPIDTDYEMRWSEKPTDEEKALLYNKDYYPTPEHLKHLLSE